MASLKEPVDKQHIRAVGVQVAITKLKAGMISAIQYDSLFMRLLAHKWLSMVSRSCSWNYLVM
jgi:hypothetical protein